jgi:Immunity protein 26
MATITITIPVASDWPTSKELARRNKVEAALEASKIMQCTGAGGGLGEMDLTYRVDDDSRVAAARAKIEAAMALLMPGFEYKIAVQGEPVRTFQVKVGDIFAIPLAERQYALGLCRFVFQRMKGFTACRVFDTLVSEPKRDGPLPATVAFDPLFVWDHSIADGTWPIVGSTRVKKGPVMYRSAGGIYNGEKYIKATDYTEDVPDLYLPGPVAVQIQLREHFGIRSADEGPGRTKR